MSFKLPWGSDDVNESNSSSRPEASISDILPSAALRTELLLLVVLCTDSMRDDLSSAFNISADMTEDIQEWPGRARVHPSGSQRSSSPQDVDSSSFQMPGLKRAAIAFFTSWRTDVLSRMGEKLSVRSESVKQAKARYQAAKRDKAYYDWAEGKDLGETCDTDQRSVGGKRFSTNLAKLDYEKRALVLHCCLLLLLSLENYPAHSRVLLQHICQSLDLPSDTLAKDEGVVARSLLETANAKMAADDVTRQRANEDASGRRWKVGLATVAGAAVIGITGGLAAPLLLGMGGAIMGGVGLGGLASLLGATIANPLTVAALFGAMGGKMTGRAVEEYEREIRDFKFVPLDETIPDDSQARPPSSTSQASELQSSHKLRVAIGISGWLTRIPDVTSPWTVFSSDSVEPFALRYERDVLLKLGATLTSILRDSAYSLAQASFLQVALPAVVSTALLPVTLLRAGSYLNNPFSLSMERSDKAGKVLASALMAKAQGERPVSLVGYSLGARVIHSCLLELASQNAFGLIENVVLMGAPAATEELSWRKIRSVAAGRVVNVYTTNDLLLAVLYRTIKAQINVAGLQPINNVNGVENFDATGVVNGHHQYQFAVGPLLRDINFEDLDMEEVEKGEQALKKENRMEKEVHEQAKRSGQLKEQEDESGRIIMIDAASAEAEAQQCKSQEKGACEPQSKSRSAPRQPTTDLLGLDDSDDNKSENSLPKTRGGAGPQGIEAESGHHNDGYEDHEDEDLASKIQMVEIDPDPESEPEDPGPPVEQVRFGGDNSGINLTWDRRELR